MYLMRGKSFTILVLFGVFLSFLFYEKAETKTQITFKDILHKIYNEVRAEEKKMSAEQLGEKASYIKILAEANEKHLGISVVSRDGRSESIGDIDVPFSIQSISKPFMFGLAMKDNEGKVDVAQKVGLNATGLRFNDKSAFEIRKGDPRQNPMVNAGAIQVTSFIGAGPEGDKWKHALNFFKALSDGKPFLGEKVFESEMADNDNNRKISKMLEERKMLGNSDPEDALVRYTKACSVMVTTKQLGIMGATLANNGVNPLTKKRLLTPNQVRDVLSQMTVNGLYEDSGEWFTHVGLATKSGVAGGLLAVVPGKYSIAVYSPRLDKAGNTVLGQMVISKFAKLYKLHMLQNNK